eukprot:jgi/Chrpa1/8160/Chrysochromulina_OHIO_Genome00001635-RA
MWPWLLTSCWWRPLVAWVCDRFATGPDRSSRFDRSYGVDGRQTARPPPEAEANQILTAHAHYEHALREGLKPDDDEVVLVPSGLWTAVNGALRPGVEALAAHLVGAGSRRGPPPRFYSWPLPPRYGGTQAATATCTRP